MDSRIFYHVTCGSCKNTFRLYEDTSDYLRYKKSNFRFFTCEDCQHKIRYEAIRKFIK